MVAYIVFAVVVIAVGIFIYLAFGEQGSKFDESRPVVIVSFADSLSAGGLVTLLQENGIKAQAVGGFTSTFQVEAPGDVDVVVSHKDVAKAQNIIKTLGPIKKS